MPNTNTISIINLNYKGHGLLIIKKGHGLTRKLVNLIRIYIGNKHFFYFSNIDYTTFNVVLLL
jgi:hypothetical protein